MTEKTASLNGQTVLPNLAGRVFVVSLVACAIILMGQLFQDSHREKDNSEAHRIYSYQQQSEFATQLTNTIVQLQNTNDSEQQDNSIAHIKQNIEDLNATKMTIDMLSKQLVSDDERNNIVNSRQATSLAVDNLITNASEVLALLQSGSSSKIAGFDKTASLYQTYHSGVTRIIDNLSENALQENDRHRQIVWWTVLAVMLMVFAVSIGFYLYSKPRIHQQFNLLNKSNEQLEQENKRREKAEQEITVQAEKTLAEQIKFKSILNATEDAIITMTENGLIDSFNQAAETMYGYSADLVLGKDIKILIPEANYPNHDDVFERYQKTGELEILGQGRETVSKRADGSEFPSQQFVSKINYMGSDLFVGIVQDITQRKKDEDNLNNALAELTQKQAALEEEERIARHVFENITASNNDTIPEVSSWCEPMGTFSGDMMLSAVLSSGGIRILLCDFTGHGLPAALGAVPVSTIHSAMAKKDLPLEVLMNELNNKLNELLPTGIFCCIAGIDLDETRTNGHVWNAGLPDVLIVSQPGEIKQRLVSDHLPLGVTKYEKKELHCQKIKLDPGDSIYALSDGITEAENESGEMFGQIRFEKLLMTKSDKQGRLVEIRNSIGLFVGKASRTDDISIVEIKNIGHSWLG